jgi:hypothetical protein
MSLMTDLTISWSCWPAEIRILILKALLQIGCKLAGFATVSREWQVIIEPHNFARISLTLSRLADFRSMIHRNRALVRYKWLCVELQEYHCPQLVPSREKTEERSNTENTRVMTAFQDLFSTLSTWEPKGDLMLDISVQFPRESDHWLRYLTVGPDITSDKCDWNLCPEKTMLTRLDPKKQGCIAGRKISIVRIMRIHNVSQEIMGELPFPNDNQKDQWWQRLPLVPARTGVLLRQQNRRR